MYKCIFQIFACGAEVEVDSLQTSVSEVDVNRWQVPFSVTPSAHSWTVYSTNLAFTGKV